MGRPSTKSGYFLAGLYLAWAGHFPPAGCTANFCWWLIQTNFQTTQPMPAHIALLIATASIQGRGEEYFRAGAYAALTSRFN